MLAQVAPGYGLRVAGLARLGFVDAARRRLASLDAFDTIRDLNKREGLTVFLVEQNAFHALKLADRAYVLVNGRITMAGSGAELLAREEIRDAYLGGAAH